MPPRPVLVIAVRRRHRPPGVVRPHRRRGNGEVGRHVRRTPLALAHNPALYSARCMVYTIQRALYGEGVGMDRAEVADGIVSALPLAARRLPMSLAKDRCAPLAQPRPGVWVESVWCGRIIDIAILRDGDGLHELTVTQRGSIVLHDTGLSLLDVAEILSGPARLADWAPGRTARATEGRD